MNVLSCWTLTSIILPSQRNPQRKRKPINNFSNTMRYKKSPEPPRLLSAPITDAPLLGMLYLVDVSVHSKETGETVKHKLLLVGCELDDIERKMRWIFDSGQESIVIKGIEKVREKVHFLSSAITQDKTPVGPVIERSENSQTIQQQQIITEPYDPKLYAIGITTTMLAKDQDHALRKVGNAILSRATVGKSHSGASLCEDSIVSVEEVPRSSGYAKARDTSNESNRAHVVRG